MASLSDYEVLSVIGTGKFGTCYKVQNKLTNKIFVWKSIDYTDMDEDRRQQLLSEIKILKQLSHPNIVKYFNHIINKASHTLYIIMECCEGGDLAQLIRKCTNSDCHFEESFIWRVLYQLSKALQGCHSFKSTSSILHRDIKPANVFLDLHGNIKLGDFGLARILKGTNKFAQSMVGTPYYMSPEILKGDKYNRKSDIWALGCLIYELCALLPPFSGNHMASLTRNITDGKFNRIPTYYSTDLQKIISFMLSVEHNYRPTIEIILHHPTVLMHITDNISMFPKLISNSLNNGGGGEFSPIPILASTSIASTFDPFDKNTTNDLRRELFRSPVNESVKLPSNRRNNCVNQKFSNSDPTHYEELDNILSTKRSASDCQTNTFTHPNEITQEIFNEALRQRLVAIKNKECLLQARELELKQREQVLIKREKQLKTMENNHRRIKKHAAGNEKENGPTRKLIAKNKSKTIMKYDDTMMSIEPNESIILPTMAKINLNTCALPQKSMQRAVSFRSPLKIQKRECKENILPPPPLPERYNATKFHTMKYTKNDLEQAVQKSCSTIPIELKKSATTMQPVATKSLSKVNSTTVTGKRKSFFGLFNINKNFGNRKSNTQQPQEDKQKEIIINVDGDANTIKSEIKQISTDIDIKSQSTPNFHTKWTVEHKRTAFEMLAIMNATEQHNDRCKVSSSSLQDESIIDDVIVNNKLVRHDRKRQSMFVLRCTSRENINYLN